jgi:hypothetical protein
VNGERERQKEVLKDVVLLFGRAVSRSRDSGFDDQLEESIRGALKTVKQELTHLRNQSGPGSRIYPCAARRKRSVTELPG